MQYACIIFMKVFFSIKRIILLTLLIYKDERRPNVRMIVPAEPGKSINPRDFTRH